MAAVPITSLCATRSGRWPRATMKPVSFAPRCQDIVTDLDVRCSDQPSYPAFLLILHTCLGKPNGTSLISSLISLCHQHFVCRRGAVMLLQLSCFNCEAWLCLTVFPLMSPCCLETSPSLHAEVFLDFSEDTCIDSNRDLKCGVCCKLKAKNSPQSLKKEESAHPCLTALWILLFSNLHFHLYDLPRGVGSHVTPADPGRTSCAWCAVPH
ncbi:PREDICTED: uncharacterized protein LOC108493735 [Lepidothrix coronata]|uniref:Uncharacterized protein LOC108493735 n=1 Tax=Lepidothrix coronata TaxID=321398 RepID=A0A6J0GMA9_9PASS|nr:PREDICTED: uncharacterized protein LOC108493735 [Lepidothrix coronata]